MPSLLIALAAFIGVAMGRVARLAGRIGIAIALVIAVALAIWLFLATRSPYALLPAAGLAVGVLYRKSELISLSPRHGGDDPDRRA